MLFMKVSSKCIIEQGCAALAVVVWYCIGFEVLLLYAASVRLLLCWSNLISLAPRDTKLLLFLDYFIPCRGSLMHVAVGLAGKEVVFEAIINGDRSY